MKKKYYWITDNIKQIIKPDWRKILIFVIIVSTLFLYMYYNNLFELNPLEWKFFAVVSSIWYAIISIPMKLGMCLHGDVWDWCSPFHEYLAYFWYFVVSYLFSCLIVWIYDKSGKKKYYRIAVIIIFLIIAYLLIAEAIGLWPFCRFINIFGVGLANTCSLSYSHRIPCVLTQGC